VYSIWFLHVLTKCPMNIHYIPNLFPKFTIVAHFIPYVVNGYFVLPLLVLGIQVFMKEGFCELKHETWIKWSLFDRLDSSQPKSKLNIVLMLAYSVPLRHFSFFTYWIFWSWWSGTQEIIISLLHPQQYNEWVSI
jgi:hypothetical protein